MLSKDVVVRAVEESGLETIGEKNLYEILDDYGAFDGESEYVKQIVKEISDSEMFLNVLMGAGNPVEAINEFVDDVSVNNGFDKDDVKRCTVFLLSNLGLLMPQEEELFADNELEESQPPLKKKSSKSTRIMTTTRQNPNTNQNAGGGRRVWPYLLLAVAIVCGIFWLIKSNNSSSYDTDKRIVKTEEFKINGKAGQKTIVLKNFIPDNTCKVSSSGNWCGGKLTSTGDLEVSWLENDSKKERDAVVTLNSSTLNVKCLIHQNEKVGFFGRVFRFLGKAILWIIGIGVVVIWGIFKIFE